MTTFKGRETAFNNGGAPTKFKGRSGFGSTMKNDAAGAADISGSNRHVAKSNMGAGSGSGPRFSTNTAFGGKRK